MPLGPYQTFGDCVRAQQNKGHSKESAEKICGAMEQELAAGEVAPQLVSSYDTAQPNENSNQMSAEEQPPKEGVKLTESEVSDVTQGLTDAKEFLASAGAPQELIDSVNKAYDVIYSKVEVAPEAEAGPAANPFA
jgi:hypothetical protein